MSDRWHKQVAVRFPPNDLAGLDELVAARNAERSQFWQSHTRSSVVLELVRAAVGAARTKKLAAADRAVKAAAKKPAKKVRR